MSTTVDLATPRSCERCKGTGTQASILDPSKQERCYRCSGRGAFPGLDIKGIVDGCFSPRTKAFRKSLKSAGCFGDVAKARIYYVWRMVRFDIGADVTMPMTASMVIGGDPFREELDAVASLIAKKIGPKHSVGAARWASVLHGTEPPPGLPDTAYEGGPVHDGNKPGFERLELK